MSEGLRYLNHLLADDVKDEYMDNDGLITTNEAIWGNLIYLNFITKRESSHKLRCRSF